MEDRRIKKTKRALKNTLIEMMTELPVEQISITALCDRAEISRITFYSHYNDKYALVDDIFQDMIRKGNELYQKHQAENNPEHDLVQNYRNVLYAIVELYYTEYAFFSQTIPGKSPYLAFSFYNYVLKTVESYTTKEGIKQKLKLKYSPKKTAGFLCYGLVGFINESHAETDSVSEIMEEASGLLTDLLTSDVLLER